jgi:hypothetical protein
MPALVAQSRTIQDTLGQIESQAKTPNLKLKRSQTHLLKSKLQSANEHLRATSDKLGIAQSPFKMPSEATGIDRFLAYINDGQAQIEKVQKKLKDISASGQPMKSSDFLLVQVKMAQAQQEIEYSSVLLSKVVDSIKSVVNIQL